MLKLLATRALALLVTAGLLTASATAAQPNQDELAKLKDQVAQLNAQQLQILASLDELKKMVRGPSAPALKPPPTMTVTGELYKGEPAAKVAIIEYADFQCPFCRRFESQIYPNIRDNYIRTGKLKYFLNHIPWAGNDPTNAPSGIGNPQAGAQLLEQIALSRDGKSYSGTFTLTAYAANKQPVASFTGVLTATRITTGTSITDLF